MACGLAGCGRVDEGLYHYDYPNGAQLPWPGLVEEMIATCSLTPREVLMIDLRGEKAASALKSLTYEQIRAQLSSYRYANPYEPQSLLDNPAKTANPPSLAGVKYAVISSNQVNLVGGIEAPSQVLVDFAYGIASFARSKYILDHPDSGTSLSLSSSARTVFLQSLSVVSTWGDPWVQPAGDEKELYQWQVAIVTEDGQLYRWEVLRREPPLGRTSTPDPNIKWTAGLQQVYDAFWALTES